MPSPVGVTHPVLRGKKKALSLPSTATARSGESDMVIARPSVRGDGAYRWLNDNDIAEAPQWLIDAAVAASKSNAGNGADGAATEPQAPIERVRAAFAVIPNEKRGWDDWNRC